MERVSPRGPGAPPTPYDQDELAGYAPPISMYDIFRRLILDEIRNGKLSASRRRRIVRYAAQMGLSAVEAGRLIETCRSEVLERGNETQRFHALHLVEPPPERISAPIRIGLMLTAAILLNVLVVYWVWLR